MIIKQEKETGNYELVEREKLGKYFPKSFLKRR